MAEELLEEEFVEADKEMKEASEPWDGGAGC